MRLTRIKVVGECAVYHCISRIVGGQFLLGDEEKEKLRQLIWLQAKFSGVEVITYCVMSNHFHLLVRVPAEQCPSGRELLDRAKAVYRKKHLMIQMLKEDLKDRGRISPHLEEGLLNRMGDVSQFMKELKLRFSKWYNKRNKRFGTVWAERFKSVLIEDEPTTVRTLAAYIDLNPIRAGMVEDPKDYRFCGYAEALGGNREARQGILGFHESNRWKVVSEEYRQYLYVDAGVSGRSDKKQMDRRAIRKVLEKGGQLAHGEILRLKIRYLTEGVILGSKEYVEEQFQEFRDRFHPRRKQGARKMKRLQLGDLASMRDLQNSIS